MSPARAYDTNNKQGEPKQRVDDIQDHIGLEAGPSLEAVFVGCQDLILVRVTGVPGVARRAIMRMKVRAMRDAMTMWRRRLRRGRSVMSVILGWESITSQTIGLYKLPAYMDLPFNLDLTKTTERIRHSDKNKNSYPH
ncbi:uncharacterized protein AlacWU_10015 [Aspergillus niger]|uniref:Uncharacterized protein n=2 Tax=Aspergillus niger TaxID=5061 RepID=A2QLF5_ASPNC|nr:uncharacterized protein BO96DRAFT_347626 [Aspergillus niger CBS 101883]XP_059600794.1 hypothetical protein An06g01010 [Aspergillus niger]PYH52486.1 hypothetical protein BO96DRAFT_347626 [Aspergillus niger CBS 101883]GJP97116.1 uncharacterized protein AlacWU_10015 [Aspergillus niger]CAK39175.1 hypothetical protein An06g01010 [Aspergillus niger]